MSSPFAIQRECFYGQTRSSYADTFVRGLVLRGTYRKLNCCVNLTLTKWRTWQTAFTNHLRRSPYLCSRRIVNVGGTETLVPPTFYRNPSLFFCLRHFASGSGRSWNCTTSGLEPLPRSINHDARSPLELHNPRPFQPAFGSSILRQNPWRKSQADRARSKGSSCRP